MPHPSAPPSAERLRENLVACLVRVQDQMALRRDTSLFDVTDVLTYELRNLDATFEEIRKAERRDCLESQELVE